MASPPRVRAALFATGMLVASPAAAQNGGSPPPPPPNAPPRQAPAARPKPPRAAPRGVAARPKKWQAKKTHEVAPPPGTPIASFPGFARLDDGKSRIFVEVSRKVEVLEKRDPARLVYRLKGASVMQRTNELPLITDFFSTPVERVQLVQDGADVDVVVNLRETTEATSQVIETPRGMVLWIDFPKSASFARDDATPDAPDRPRAKRTTATKRIGGDADQGPHEDLPPPPVQSD